MVDISSKFKISSKHVLIDKANSSILVASLIAVALVVFSIVACVALSKEMGYQSKVINLREKAKTVLGNNVTAVDSVVAAYKTFEAETTSVIGTADKNSVVVLDALPSKYDFPALTSSIEALALESGTTLSSITGSDNEATAEQDSLAPKPIEIPFEFSATGKLASLQVLVGKLERSIRPIVIKSISFAASGDNIQVNISAVTYYQPEKQLGITESIVPFSKTLTKGVAK
jgi:Tfp pilus assembly protein PilO